MSKRIMTMDEMRNKGGSGANHDHDSDEDSGSDSDTDRRQSFFVGGGQHSGQQVLGPNRRGGGGGGGNDGELVEHIFESAREHGAEVRLLVLAMQILQAPTEAVGTSYGGRGGALRFPTTGGRRVGDPIQVAGSPRVPQPEQQPPERPEPRSIDLIMWSNGFSVGDGPLRAFDDPANRDFLQQLMRGQVPVELARQFPGEELDLHMIRKSTEYVKPKPKPFSGSGQRLGDIVPNVVGAPAAAAAAVPAPTAAGASEGDPEELIRQADEQAKVDTTRPTARVRVRLPGGRQLTVTLNADHTVSDLRQYVVTAVPSLAFVEWEFTLQCPPSVVGDESKSLKEAGVANAVVVVKPVPNS